jgi:hypothetical protein
MGFSIEFFFTQKETKIDLNSTYFKKILDGFGLRVDGPVS